MVNGTLLNFGKTYVRRQLKRVIFDQWPKLHLGLDALSKILKGISFQGVHWNLFDLTPYKGLCIVMHLLNGHFPKDLALKDDYFVYHEVFIPLNVTILLLEISHFSTNSLLLHVTLFLMSYGGTINSYLMTFVHSWW